MDYVTDSGLVVSESRHTRSTVGSDAVAGFGRAAVDRFWLGIDLGPELPADRDVDREIDRAAPRPEDELRAELERLGALRCERIGGQPR